ncbi:MAG: tRNA uridine-5-carboxymethylaminomethyl(34) synthesis GTPase MnmE [Bacteroidota bacterium]
MLNINPDDTIAALATPPGTGAIAVVRISGKQTFSLTDGLFLSRTGKRLEIGSRPSHSIVFCIINDEEPIDEVLVSVFKGPNTFTGEDTLEISCHGSTFVQQRILDLLSKRGIRMAQPGEFTMRAFLHGKMDLSQAEAVADLIASDTVASHRLALNQLRGGFSDEIKALRQELVQFASLIELELDFAEEDVEFASRNQLKQSVQRLQEKIRRLIRSFEVGNVIRNGIPVVIAGKPNAGKSTLLNALLNDDRAIVSDIPGTTRDTVEEEIKLGGIRFRFIDTAGIRETTDAIEKIGVEKTMEKIRQSPIIIYLFDVNETSCGELKLEIERLRNEIDPSFIILPVGNKIDQQDTDLLEKEFSGVPDTLLISAKSATNLDNLTSILLRHTNAQKLQSGDTIVTSARHVEELRKTDSWLEKVIQGMERNTTNDFLAGDLRFALHHLGNITGEISNDELLENIFSKFCIGK